MVLWVGKLRYDTPKNFIWSTYVEANCCVSGIKKKNYNDKSSYTHANVNFSHGNYSILLKMLHPIAFKCLISDLAINLDGLSSIFQVIILAQCTSRRFPLNQIFLIDFSLKVRHFLNWRIK